MSNRITIIDVAREAGVSVGTASQALNNKKGVSTVSKDRVKSAAQQLNYHPSIAARELKNRRTNIVSLHIIVPNSGIINPSSWNFYFRVIQGFNNKLKEHDIRMHLEFNKLEEVSDHYQLEKIIKGYHISAGAFLVYTKGDYSGLLELKNMSLPIITIYSKVYDSISSIGVNNFEASKNIVTWLGNLGHKRISHISGPSYHFVSEERKKGFFAAMHRNGYRNNVEGDWTIESGSESFKKLISHSQLPTAIFCANDHMAAGVIQASIELKIQIPEDISLVGFDDDIISQVSHPRLTTVHQPLFEMGQLAAEMLIKSKHVNSNKTFHKVLPTQLVIRNSVISVSE